MTEETKTLDSDGVYVIIHNIPRNYRSTDLRKFFKSFLESTGFLCFHYRHRPEVQRSSDFNNDRFRRATCCCVVKVVSNRVDEFIKSYNGEHWTDGKGESLTSCCFVKKILICEKDDKMQASSSLCKRGVSSNVPLDQETFSKNDLDSLIELNPPHFMPNGNVGTATAYFLKEIQACNFPPFLIRKLGLQFPRNIRSKVYSNVPFDYKKWFGNNKAYNQRRFPRQKPMFSSFPKYDQAPYKKPWCSRKQEKEEECEEKDNQEESEEEEWDRVESLHDDPSGQERNKERLFEEKIELKWEKGGSGLVFYTDAQFWDAKEGDFDAKTSDDWDIDTRIYEEPGVDNDKDMMDLVKMRLEKKRRNGNETEVDRRFEFAAFEKYNKGFGTKVLESQGWKQGQGVGKNACGIAEPIPNEGQRPSDKKGLGYYGKRLDHSRAHRNRRKRRNSEEDSIFIFTIYDDPNLTDPPDSVLSSSFAKLKYRKEFLKERQVKE